MLGASAAPFALRIDVAHAATTTLAAVSASGDRALDIDFQNAPAAGHTLIQDYTEDGTGFTADPTWQSSTVNGGNCNGTIVRADAPVNSTWTTGMDISARYPWPGCARYVAGQTSDTSSQYGLMRLARGLGQLAQDLGDVGANPATNGVIAAYTDNGIQTSGIMAQTTSRKTLPANRYYAYSIDVGTVSQINCPQIRFEWQGQQDTTTNSWVTAIPVDVCSATPPFNLVKRTYEADARTIFTARLQSANGVKVAPGNENMLFRVNNLTVTGAGNDGGFDNLRFIDATPTVTKAFASTNNTVGDTVNLTITVHNSAEEAAKSDFGLTDDLVDGLQVIGSPTTTCGNGTVTVTNGNLITLAGGDLAGDQATCVITVAVKSSTAGTYVNGPSQMTGSFVDLPTQDVQATWALASDQPEATTTPLNTAVTLDPFANFVPVDGDTTPSRPNTSTFLFSNGPTSMTTTEGQPAGASVSADGKTLTVPNEGVWTVAADGNMTFTPDAGFLAAPSAVLYTAADSTGNLAQPAPITVTYPDVVDLTGAGDQGATIAVNPQGTAIDPTTAVFPTTGQPAGATVSSDGKTLTVPGEGVYTIAADGAITFTPDPALVGDPTPVTYTAADADGNVADPAQITLTYPDVSDVSKSGVPGQPVSVAPAGDQLDLSTVVFPAAGFTTSPTPLLYTASDTQGSVAEPATVTVLYPSATPVSGSGDQGTPVVLKPTFDPTSDPTTVKLTGGPEGSTLSPDGKTLTVPNEGTWTVNPDGSITFTPEPGFQGSPTPATFTAVDATGEPAGPATATVTYPDVEDAAVDSTPGATVVVTPTGTNIDPATVEFPAAGQPSGAVVSEGGKVLTVPGEGVWMVLPDGSIRFVPEAGLKTSPTPVVFTARDPQGHVAEPGTITVTYPTPIDTSTPTPPYTGTPEPTLTVPTTTAPTQLAPTLTVSGAPTPVVTQPEEPQVWIDRLARTGANVEGMLGAAGGMIAAAVGLLAFSRRKRNK
ncbi:hypothetical protein JT358_15765 [Micrococcales bacterium 31B]|nr:hypothetical protein [Micrococcales bacterium 31B]